MHVPRYSVWGIPGLPEVGAGDDLVALIADAVSAQAHDDAEAALRDGDILVVTSKIVSSDPEEHVAAIKTYIDYGFDHLVFHAPGLDQSRFLALYAKEILPRLRKLTASS